MKIWPGDFNFNQCNGWLEIGKDKACGILLMTHLVNQRSQIGLRKLEDEEKMQLGVYFNFRQYTYFFL